MTISLVDAYAQFEAHGVAILPQVLGDEDLAPVIQDLENWIDRKAEKLFAAGDIADLYEKEPFLTRYARLYAQSPKIGRGLDIMFLRSEGIFQFLNNKKLLDAIAPLVGSEITCNPIQHIRAKPPTRLEGHDRPSFHNVPWHQDAGVMMKEAEASNILTCWIPLVDITPEMGSLKALPGCQKRGYIPHIAAEETMIDPDELPEVEPLDLACQKGDVIIMSRFTPHSSTPNTTDLCRWSLDLRYQTTGHHTGRTAHPEFVVRSNQQPVGVDFESWRSSWLDALENPRGFAGHRIHQ